MRAYLNGTLSVYQETFIPQDLWFSTEECNDNTVVSEDCICVSGLTCESKTEDKEFSCRWKGVVLTHINNEGKEVETEDFTIDELLTIIKDKNMRLTNISAFFDTDVEVMLTKIIFVEKDKETELDIKLVDEVEFMA